MSLSPIEMFRKATSFLYREIGILRECNHPKIYSKANQEFGFFGHRRKRLACQLYHETNNSEDPVVILRPYERMTGLTLEDIYRAFSEGDWRAPSGRIAYGGPKWAAIASAAVALRHAIDQNEEQAAFEQTAVLERSEHNNGRLVEKFPVLDDCTRL